MKFNKNDLLSKDRVKQYHARRDLINEIMERSIVPAPEFKQKTPDIFSNWAHLDLNDTSEITIGISYFDDPNTWKFKRRTNNV